MYEEHGLNLNGDTGRFEWSLGEFAQARQDHVNRWASKGRLFKIAEALKGVVPTDAPWSFELAATSSGHVCGNVEEFLYSYADASSLEDSGCVRVWDTGSRSYGPYEDMNISISVVLHERDKNLDGTASFIFCDHPEECRAQHTPTLQ